MTLIYSGNSYKYETEAIMKLFLPAQKFGFVYDADEPFVCAGDFAFLRKRVMKTRVLLYVIVRYGEKLVRLSNKLSTSMDDNACEEELSRLLYTAMSRLTGITSEWGILTGVRPVKQVRRLAEKGLTSGQIADTLGKKYLVSEKKCRLAIDTAEAQKPVLDGLKGRNDTFGLYISIPFCPTRCSYCSFISQAAAGAAVKKLIPIYIENLCTEIRHTAQVTAELGLKPDTVYIGGGTPTVLTAAQLARIMQTAAESFDLSAVREYTVEAGRPDTVTAEKLTTLKEHGCTRISINPQTLNNEVLRVIGREHTAAEFFAAYHLAREMGFGSINTDIIAGLPTDTPDSFARTLGQLTDLSPESITVHTLSIKRSARLNAEDGKQEIMKSPAAQMVDHAAEKLYLSGYRPYYMYRQKNMVDNLENIGWVKPGHESLYNIYIMEEVQTIIALGAAGSTKLIDRRGGRLERIFNYKYPLDYNNNFELMLKRKDDIVKFFVNS